MSNMNFNFPLRGLDKGQLVSQQPEGTSSDMNNMRAFDVLGNRARGGQRAGQDKWGDGDQIGAAEQPVVAMVIVSSVV